MYCTCLLVCCASVCMCVLLWFVVDLLVCLFVHYKRRNQNNNTQTKAHGRRAIIGHITALRGNCFALVALAGSTVLIGGAPNFLPCPPRVRERCRWCARVAVLHCHRCAQPVCQVHFIVCFACGSDFCSGGCYYGHDCHPPLWLSPLPHHYHFVCQVNKKAVL